MVNVNVLFAAFFDQTKKYFTVSNWSYCKRLNPRLSSEVQIAIVYLHNSVRRNREVIEIQLVLLDLHGMLTLRMTHILHNRLNIQFKSPQKSKAFICKVSSCKRLPHSLATLSIEFKTVINSVSKILDLNNNSQFSVI
jgi:hypothetical protein